MVRWARLLPGSWIVQNGVMGTTPDRGQAYAAFGDGIAVVGAGMTVYAYAARTGRPLWSTALNGFPAGSEIVSARAWPGVVSVGVGLPAMAGGRRAGPSRKEVILGAVTGDRIRVYPAAAFGGAVAADPAATVVVGQRAVTSYANRTGKVLWSRTTGPAAQAWQVDGDRLYVTVATGGYLGTSPVTALRQISLRTGAQRLLRPSRHSFAGTFSLAFDGAVFFSRGNGITAYSASTGAPIWHRPYALLESVDAVAHRLYLTVGNALVGVNPLTGAGLVRDSGAGAGASGGLYGVREGAALGLDQGALGRAWGYDVASQRVLWTSRPLPWPHYFVDPSGIGGSASPGHDGVLLSICAALGPPAVSPGTRQSCARPELVAINR